MPSYFKLISGFNYKSLSVAKGMEPWLYSFRRSADGRQAPAVLVEREADIIRFRGMKDVLVECSREGDPSFGPTASHDPARPPEPLAQANLSKTTFVDPNAPKPPPPMPPLPPNAPKPGTVVASAVPEEPAKPKDRPLNEEELEAMSRPQLVDLAERKGIKPTGNTRQLIKKLIGK